MNIYLENEGKRESWIDANEWEVLKAIGDFLVVASGYVGLQDITRFFVNLARGEDDFYELKCGPYLLSFYT